MRIRTFLLSLLLLPLAALAQQVQYSRADSTQVVSLLRQASAMKPSTNWMIYFARSLRDVPYVAKTLEVNKQEKLIVNLRQLDCTTYVETVLALSECARRRQTSFASYTAMLKKIRYKGGSVRYASRNHYFSQWILSNTANGLVMEISTPRKLFSSTQKLLCNYMTLHPQYYPMMGSEKGAKANIAGMEKELTGQKVNYIPKTSLGNTQMLRQTVKDGDILAIVTNKQGLDTSHIGIAVWHKDGLHLLNASQIRKRVVEEPMTLKKYMSQHPTQTGIRVVRVR